jgi:hypothetical protein
MPDADIHAPLRRRASTPLRLPPPLFISPPLISFHFSAIIFFFLITTDY